MLGFQFVLCAAVATLGGIYCAPVTQECKTCNTSTQIPEAHSLLSNEDNYSGNSEYKKRNKHESKHKKHSPGKQNKEFLNIKQHVYKTKSSSEESLEVLTTSNVSHLHADIITPYQNDTVLQNDFLRDNTSFTLIDKSSEEVDDSIEATTSFTLIDKSSEEVDDSIEATTANVKDRLTQKFESDEVNSDEDFSTEDYEDISTTEDPSSIENDRQSVEDVDVSTEEPDEIISNESYDYYSDEDNSTEAPLGITTPEDLDSNESNSVEDIYQTTPYSKVNISMESVEETLDSNESSNVEDIYKTAPNPEDKISSKESMEDEEED